MRDFPWRILLMSVAITVVWRPILTDNVEYVIACWISGAVLGLVSGYMKNTRG
jgi:hypothetical protein